MSDMQLAKIKGLNDKNTIKMNSIIEITIQIDDIDSAVDSIISALYSVSFPGCWTLDKINNTSIDNDVVLNDSYNKDDNSDREKIKNILESISINGSICGTVVTFKYTDDIESNTNFELDFDFESKLEELENGDKK